MQVFVSGASGFIGAHVVAALKAKGHDVVQGVRQNLGEHGTIVTCDFARDIDSDLWATRLIGIDAVVNCVGILREKEEATFERVHHLVPKAMFDGAVKAGVKTLIQVSALGDPERTDFIRTKHDGDAALMSLDADWCVLRPSLVYSPAGSYGGSSLIRALSALPVVVPVAGDGNRKVQPICAEDLASIVAACAEGQGRRQCMDVVGPETMTLTDVLLTQRQWLGYGRAFPVSLPHLLVSPMTRIADLFVKGPFGQTMYRMLLDDNIGRKGAFKTLVGATGIHARSMDKVLSSHPGHVQDRWHARLYFLRPFLRLTLAVLWIMSGLLGLGLAPPEQVHALLEPSGLSFAWLAVLIRIGSLVNLVLGFLILFQKRVQMAGVLMIASLLAYSLFTLIYMPGIWLHPFGPLLKNVVLFPAVMIMMVLEQER